LHECINPRWLQDAPSFVNFLKNLPGSFAPLTLSRALPLDPALRLPQLRSVGAALLAGVQCWDERGKSRDLDMLITTGLTAHKISTLQMQTRRKNKSNTVIALRMIILSFQKFVINYQKFFHYNLIGRNKTSQ
jgi:hypothetical protein